MKKKDDGNKAVESFKHSRPKNFYRNRFFALVIDFIVIMLLCQIVFAIFGIPDWKHYLQTQEAVRGLTASDTLVVERMKLYQECFLITLSIGVVYEAFMLVFFGVTIGKLVFGMRVVNVKTDKNFYVGKLMLAMRSVIKAASIYLLSAIPFLFMCLTTFGNSEGRSGFDGFAGTKVIKVRSK